MSVTVEQSVVVTTRTVEREIVSAGAQGPRGAIGPIGPEGGTGFTRIASVTISALRIVWEAADGTIRPLDYRDADNITRLVGIAIGSGDTGVTIAIQRSGPLDAAGLGLTPGLVWLGIDGALTQTPPTDGYDVLIGYVVAPSRLYLDIQPPVDLE